MYIAASILLFFAQSAGAGGTEIKLRCEATNGFVVFVTFDEATRVVTASGNRVESSINNNEVVYWTKFKDGSEYIHKLDRTTGNMKVWDNKTNAFDSSYSCAQATATKF